MKDKYIAVYTLILGTTVIPLPEPLVFKVEVDFNGNYQCFNDDIKQLTNYGFALELVSPVQYFQDSSADSYPVYQLIYDSKNLENFENNLQLLNALARRVNVEKV